MKKLKLLIPLVFLINPFSVSADDKTDPVFAEFKKSLNVDKEYKINCQIATFKNSQEPIIRKYRLYVKNDNNLLVTLYPPRDRRQLLLLVKDQIWQYFPKINKTMNINTAITINGSVNITDLLSSSLFNFYILSNHIVNKDNKTHIFVFKAKNNNSPYGSVRFFFRDGSIYYLEAYARSGILLKKLFFHKLQTAESGNKYPSQIKIINALRENDYSLIQMSEMQAVTIPDYYFNPSALDKIREN